jgi:hypothetical protein
MNPGYLRPSSEIAAGGGEASHRECTQQQLTRKRRRIIAEQRAQSRRMTKELVIRQAEGQAVKHGKVNADDAGGS